MFMAIGIEMMALICMRRARTVAQLCDWTTATHAMDAVHPVSALLILVPGLYMMLTVWGWGMAWTDVALVLTLTLSALGPAISGRRLTAIYKAARTAPDGPLPASLVRQVHDPVLRMSLQTMAQWRTRYGGAASTGRSSVPAHRQAAHRPLSHRP